MKLWLERELREKYRIFCSIVVYPVIPKRVDLLKLIPTASHNIEDINETLEVFLKSDPSLKMVHIKKLLRKLLLPQKIFLKKILILE